MFDQEEIQGDEAFVMPNSPQKFVNEDDLRQYHSEDLQRKKMIQRMEIEGLNFTLFFKNLKTLKKGDYL